MGLVIDKSLVTVSAEAATGFSKLRTAEKTFRGSISYSRDRISVVEHGGPRQWVYPTARPVEAPPTLQSHEHEFGRLEEGLLREACTLINRKLGEDFPRRTLSVTFYLEDKTITCREASARQTAVFFTVEVGRGFMEPPTGSQPFLSAGGPLRLERVERAVTELQTRLALPREHSRRSLRRLLDRGNLLLGPQAVGTIWHEVAHLLEWDVAQHWDVLGKPICRFEGLKVSEEPRQATFGWNAVTDEGIPARERLLIEDGLAVGVLDSWGFRQSDGSSGYIGVSGGLPVPRTVNLRVTCPGRASLTDLYGRRAIVIENLKTSIPDCPDNEENGLWSVVLRVSRIEGIVAEDGLPVATYSVPVDCRLHLRDFNDRTCETSLEQGGNEPGFCLKRGQFVRSTQTAPAVLVTGALRDRLSEAVCPL
jgi:hypothetical protein